MRRFDRVRTTHIPRQALLSDDDNNAQVQSLSTVGAQLETRCSRMASCMKPVAEWAAGRTSSSTAAEREDQKRGVPRSSASLVLLVRYIYNAALIMPRWGDNLCLPINLNRYQGRCFFLLNFCRDIYFLPDSIPNHFWGRVRDVFADLKSEFFEVLWKFRIFLITIILRWILYFVGNMFRDAYCSGRTSYNGQTRPGSFNIMCG